MPIKYIGKTTDFKGKPLWEIIGNLKNFGVGRVVVRSMFERYKEPCYYRIQKVETLPNEETRKVCVWVDKVFRGRKYPLTMIRGVTYKADFRLIPKDEEAAYCRVNETFERPEKIFPSSVSFPPLLKELLIRDLLGKGITPSEEPKLKVAYCVKEDQVRVAQEGEEPNVEVKIGLGKTCSPQLYENILQ